NTSEANSSGEVVSIPVSTARFVAGQRIMTRSTRIRIVLAIGASRARGKRVLHHNLALALASCARSGEAAREHSEAHRLDPGWPPTMNDLAWLLATDDDAKLRNGAEAVRLAERAGARTARRGPN